MKPKNLVLFVLVISSILLLSGTRINPLTDNPSFRQDTFPPPQNLWVDTLACIAYWDEPAGDSLPDGYYVTLGSFQPWDYTDCTYYDIPSFLEYGYTTYIDVWAKYGDSLSLPVRDTFTSGYLPIPRNLDAETWDDVVALTWEVPHRPDTTVMGSFPYWVHSIIPCAGTPNEYGVETDGDHIYTTQSNGSLIYKYDVENGYLINSLTISGVSNIRDLAYNDNNNLFYGGNGSTTCFVMDFNSMSLISTFTAPVEIQAIAYDEDQEGLWACSWSSDIMLFDLSGNLITSIPNPSMNITGLAYDNVSDGGPYLWGFTDFYGGADLVKIEISSGTFIGNMSVYPRVGGSGPPGGLFIENNLFVIGATTLGGILQNDRIFGLELFNWNGIPPPMVPPNLLGYTLYVNDDSLDYIPFIGEDTTTYYDTNSYPFNSYLNYEVTALYDMEPYGMPGDTGESYPEGPVQVYYQMYSILPFEEDWTSGTFELNEWENDETWEVISQIGNPEPCARFQGDVMTSDYSSKLTSVLIDGVGPGTPYIDGCIWLEYDIALEDINSTGLESLVVEAGNEEGWFAISEFSNDSSSFSWQHYKHDITNFAFGEIFKIRFKAQGVNSTDISAWYLDNIEVYRLCMPVEIVSIEALVPAHGDLELHLAWNSPYACHPGGSTAGEWLFWDDGENDGGIGLTGGGVFSVASHWDSDMLATFDGMAITKIRFVPYINSANTVISMKVWEGTNAGTLLLDQTLTSYIAGEWNEVELAYPVYIDISKELWFGYTCDSPEGENPAGHDDGPAVDGYGDMIALDDTTWEPISNYGSQFDINWNLQAWVCDTKTEQERELQGYRIYKDGSLLDFTADTHYIDYVSQVFVVYDATYEITAVYEDCESPSYSQYVLIMLSTQENKRSGNIEIYPNPARESIYIESDKTIEEILLYNKLGKLVSEEHIVHNKVQITTSNLEAGVYMVRVLLEDGQVVSRKVVVYK